MKKYLICVYYFFTYLETSLSASEKSPDFQTQIPNVIKKYIFTYLGSESDQRYYRLICKNWCKLINDNLKFSNPDTLIIRKNKEFFALLKNDKTQLQYIIGPKDPHEITTLIIEKLPEIFKSREIPNTLKLENNNFYRAISCFSNLKSFILIPNWFSRNYRRDPENKDLSQINFKKSHINHMILNGIKNIKTLSFLDMPFFLRPNVDGNDYILLKEYIHILSTHSHLQTVSLPLQFTDIAVFWTVFHNIPLSDQAKKIVLKRITKLKITEFFPFKDISHFPPFEFINDNARDWSKYLSPFTYVKKITMNYPSKNIIQHGVLNLFEELFLHHKIRKLVFIYPDSQCEEAQIIENILRSILENTNHELNVVNISNEN